MYMVYISYRVAYIFGTMKMHHGHHVLEVVQGALRPYTTLQQLVG